MSFNNLNGQPESQILSFLAFWLAACLICIPYMGIYPLFGWGAASVFVLWFFYQLN